MSLDKDLGESQERDNDLTRRQWILRLGELVALAGVSGLVPELAASIAAQQSQSTSVTALPLGLYEASQDHLVHALSSGGKTWTPPPGSETDYVLPAAAYKHEFFSTEEIPVVTRFVEILLGKAEPAAISKAVQWLDLWLASAGGVRRAAQQLDPLHRILAVKFYGEASVRELETADPQEVVRAGFHALRALSRQLHGHEFLQLSESQQGELVESAGTAQAGTELRKLFELARTQAIRGYYTTAEGLKELDYRGNAYYGESPGCQKLTS